MEKKNRKPLIVEFEASHDGCPAIESTLKVHDSSTRYIMTSGSDGKNTYGVEEFRSPEIEKLVEKYAKHPGIRKIDVLMKKGDRALVSIIYPKDTLFVHSAGRTGCVVLPFTGTVGGVDHYTILAPSEKSYAKLMALLEEKFEFKLKSKHFLKPKEELALDAFNTSGFLKLASANKLLTERQVAAFELACKRGYYARSKKTTLEELARELGISKPAYAELLRKAESKLLPVFNEILALLRLR
ncbi:MAG: helix-turn-helix domain-containing protein [Candidatus Micrarchaeota archaeon]